MSQAHRGYCSNQAGPRKGVCSPWALNWVSFLIHPSMHPSNYSFVIAKNTLNKIHILIVFKCVIQRHEILPQCRASITTVYFQKPVIIPNRNPVPIKPYLPSSLPPSAWEPLLCFASMNLPPLDTSYKWDCMPDICRSISPSTLSSSLILIVAPISISLLFWGWLLFHCVDVPIVFIHLEFGGHLRCLPP